MIDDTGFCRASGTFVCCFNYATNLLPLRGIQLQINTDHQCYHCNDGKYDQQRHDKF